MENLLNTLIKKKDHKDFKAFIAFSADQPRRLLLRNDIIQLYRGYCDREQKNKQFREQSSIFNFIKKGQELIVDEGYLALLHRHAIARYDFYRIRHDGEVIEQIPLSSYLDLKDRIAGDTNAAPLQIDFMPFYDFSPSIRDVRSVGNGIRFLNRFMSSNFFSRPEQWNAKLFEFLKLHQYNGRQLLINGGLASGPENLFSGLEKTIRTRQWKLTYFVRHPERGQLFKMGAKPDEITNYWDDPTVAHIKHDLLMRLTEWMIRCEQPQSSNRLWETPLHTRWYDWLHQQPKDCQFPTRPPKNER